MFTIDKSDIDALSAGAMILGSGGGGHTKILSGLVKQQLEMYGPAKIITTEEVSQNCVIVPIAFIGAPLVMIEKIPNIKLFETLLFKIQNEYQNKEIVLMPAEIGGCNSLTPFLLASKHKIPILDADLIGRAFPKMTMCKPAVLRYPPNPTILADCHGNGVTINLDDIAQVENQAREIVNNFGSYAAVASFIFSDENALLVADYTITQSISHALTLGKNLLENKQNLSALEKSIKADFLANGSIENIFHDIEGGFLNGHMSIRTNDKKIIKIYFQNEFLLAKMDDQIIAESPDIISVIDINSGLPITTESLKYALKVAVFRIKAPDFWSEEIAKTAVHYAINE
jgi:DUF917 family protein